jgi:hypothetical protein
MLQSRIVGLFSLIAGLGMIWAAGCSKSGTGPHYYQPYTIALALKSPSVQSVVGRDTLICRLLYYQQDTLDNAKIYFHTAAQEDSLGPYIMPFSYTSRNSPTGMNPAVIYFPHNYSGAKDTIYATYEDTAGVVLAQSAVIVDIGSTGSNIWSLNITPTPSAVVSDTGTSIITCHLYYQTLKGDSLVAGKQIRFNTEGNLTSGEPTITPLTTTTSDSLGCGTAPTVYYHPNLYPEIYDIIYAYYVDGPDTLVIASATVDILHPSLSLVSITPNPVPTQGQGTVTCNLSFGTQILDGGKINLVSLAQLHTNVVDSLKPEINSPVSSSSTLPTGTDPTIFYQANYFAGSLDTVVAVVKAATDTSVVVATDTLYIQIAH